MSKLRKASHTCRRNLASTWVRSSTTRVSPATEELARLYRRMVEIDIDDFPSDSRPDPDPTETGTSVMHSPHESYCLGLRAAGRELAIGRALRYLIRRVREMTEAREE